MDLIHFTQNKGHAVHASTKENDIIRFGDNHAWLKEKELEENSQPNCNFHTLDPLGNNVQIPDVSNWSGSFVTQYISQTVFNRSQTEDIMHLTNKLIYQLVN